MADGDGREEAGRVKEERAMERWMEVIAFDVFSFDCLFVCFFILFFFRFSSFSVAPVIRSAEFRVFDDLLSTDRELCQFRDDWMREWIGV